MNWFLISSVVISSVFGIAVIAMLNDYLEHLKSQKKDNEIIVALEKFDKERLVRLESKVLELEKRLDNNWVKK